MGPGPRMEAEVEKLALEMGVQVLPQEQKLRSG